MLKSLIFPLFLLSINAVMSGKLFFSQNIEFINYVGLPFGVVFAIFMLLLYFYYKERVIIVGIINILNLTILMLWVNNIVCDELQKNLSIEFETYLVPLLLTVALIFAVVLLFGFQDSSKAYGQLFFSYTLIPFLAYTFGWSLVWFSSFYLITLFTFNALLIGRQFFGGRKVNSVDKGLLVLLVACYLLTVTLFLINEFYPNTILNKILQPYALKARLQVLGAMAEVLFFIISSPLTSISREFILLQSFPLIEVETSSNPYICEMKNGAITTTPTTKKSFWGGSYGTPNLVSSGSSSLFLSSRPAASNFWGGHSISSLLGQYVIASNRAFRGFNTSTHVETTSDLITSIDKVELTEIRAEKKTLIYNDKKEIEVYHPSQPLLLGKKLSSIPDLKEKINHMGCIFSPVYRNLVLDFHREYSTHRSIYPVYDYTLAEISEEQVWEALANFSIADARMYWIWVNLTENAYLARHPIIALTLKDGRNIILSLTSSDAINDNASTYNDLAKKENRFIPTGLLAKNFTPAVNTLEFTHHKSYCTEWIE